MDSHKVNEITSKYSLNIEEVARLVKFYYFKQRQDLIDLLLKHNVSQSEIARTLGVSRQTIFQDMHRKKGIHEK